MALFQIVPLAPPPSQAIRWYYVVKSQDHWPDIPVFGEPANDDSTAAGETQTGAESESVARLGVRVAGGSGSAAHAHCSASEAQTELAGAGAARQRARPGAQVTVVVVVDSRPGPPGIYKNHLRGRMHLI